MFPLKRRSDDANRVVAWFSGAGSKRYRVPIILGVIVIESGLCFAAGPRNVSSNKLLE
ncbi:hypothetical protein RMSM_06708 [Rhodopirellula maiorica SM1]|uniref:Uncharacterized protein n=1 Tax=Rhodopirellula maiorica SM1 TaxID=1265738 RepID=M5RAH6_9BACT|nr:hypothetical protein RMSM_06708 [Rhodopirellula maiorica SM1]